MTARAVAPRVVDARDLAASGYAAAAFPTLDSLVPGERFVLLAVEDPRALLLRLQAERKGVFEWAPLEGGPPLWRVEIVRRDASPGAERRVTEALVWDHERLDGLEQEAFGAWASGDARTAREKLAAFAHGLRRHIRFEEELLFPEFEARTGFPSHGTPTAAMRDEHRKILGLLDAIERGIGDPAAPMDGFRRSLRRVLAEHNHKEEEVLYIGVELAMSAAENDDLVARIQRLG